MIFNEALTYLLSLGHETLSIKLGLKNTERLLEALENPHRQFPSVQIAGTNGKGSTAVMLESICRVAGIRTGLFTSPHLISITERIRIDGEQISESEFAKLTEQVKTTAEKLVEQHRLETLPTFFEHVTAIALLAFRDAQVELAILETGLGGRLDSTTAAGAGIVAITPIAMDHEEYLGDTIAKIAAEKAAIIRPGVTAIVAPQTDDRALGVVKQRCKEVGVKPVILRAEDVLTGPILDPRIRPAKFRKGSFTINSSNCTYESLFLGLRGAHQLINASVAVALAEALKSQGFAVPKRAMREGLRAASHPGRLEYWPGRPPVLFDGAHNPAAAKALSEFLMSDGRPITMIFAVMRDKDLEGIAVPLLLKAKHGILTMMDNRRVANTAQVRRLIPPLVGLQLHETNSPAEAWQLAQRVTPPDGIVCVTGSLYLVGEMQKYLHDSGRFAETHLKN